MKARLAVSLATLGILGLVVPVTGTASTASVSGPILYITAAAGETNDISINVASYGVAITDEAGITAGAGCQQQAANEVSCGGYSGVQADLGDGNDRFADNYQLPDTVNAGPGNDTVLGGEFNDLLNGGAGDDSLDGDSENDVINGEGGNDELVGDDADDAIDGGQGQDRINGDGPTGVFAGNDTITANDGEPDVIDCGFGEADAATVDSTDTANQCESVDVVGGGGGGDGSSVQLVDTPSTLKMGKFLKRGLRFKIEFSEPGEAQAVLFVKKKKAKALGLGKKDTVLAAETAAVPEGGTYPAKLKPKRKFRDELKELERVPCILGIVFNTDDGRSADTQKVKFVQPD